MSRRTIIWLIALSFCWGSSPVEASNWMFQPSYFSRGVPAETAKQIPSLNGRSAYRRPFLHANPGGAVRGGFRINRFQIQSGISTDTTYIRENWFQFQPAP